MLDEIKAILKLKLKFELSLAIDCLVSIFFSLALNQNRNFSHFSPFKANFKNNIFLRYSSISNSRSCNALLNDS